MKLQNNNVKVAFFDFVKNVSYKLCRYVTIQPNQLSLPSRRGRLIE